MLEPRGKNNSGYRVAEVVEIGNEFETHSNLVWKDCSNEVTNNYWYDANNNTFKKLPDAVLQSTAGVLAVDAEGNPTEEYVWDWDTETWSKQIL